MRAAWIMAALSGVGSGAAAASGSAKTSPAASTVDALSMSRLESLLSRMFGPAAFGLDASAHLTTFTTLGIRRQRRACRKGYHTRHHAAGLLASHREGRSNQPFIAAQMDSGHGWRSRPTHAGIRELAAGLSPNDVRFRDIADIGRWVAPIVSDADGPKADIERLKIQRCNCLLAHRVLSSMGVGSAPRLDSERRKASTCCVNLLWVPASVSATS